MSSAPLVPAECDLRNFQFMPFDVQRLLTSETWILGNGDEKAAAITLWMESWHQIPAGSLPNNDRMLAHLSQSGVKWKRVKNHALRGWIEASDGRLYHPVVAEKALEAWIEKLSNSISGATGNAKRWGVDVDVDGLKRQFVDAVAMLRRVAPQSPALKKKIVVTIGVESPPDNPPDSPPDSGSDRKGQGQGQGQGQGYIKAAASPEETPAHLPAEIPPPPGNPSPDQASARSTQIAVLLRRNGADSRTHGNSRGIAELVGLNATDTQVLNALETARQRREETGSSQPVTAAYIVPIVQELMAQPARGAGPRKTAAQERAEREHQRFVAMVREHPDHGEIIDMEAE